MAPPTNTLVDLTNSSIGEDDEPITTTTAAAGRTDSSVRGSGDGGSSGADDEEEALQVSFSHVHLYVNHVEDVAVYKAFEDMLNSSQSLSSSSSSSVDDIAGSTTMTTTTTSRFVPHNRDIVKQLLAGFGFRVTGARTSTEDSNTKSVLVTSRDPKGVQFVITSIDPNSSVQQDVIPHFDASNVKQFFEAHAGRQGIAVLGFFTNSVTYILSQYQRLHPNLLRTNFIETYKTAKILEVYAYYKGDSADEVDTGTVLRFVEPISIRETRDNGSDDKDGDCRVQTMLLPGLESVSALFDKTSHAAYCDHWVSNVYSRTGFLKNLEDTLGFNPKVDFNAGVVAAGEAQIESTVTGNTSTMLISEKSDALKDQSQVYLPINNALSRVGHVYGFLQELGQGIQHIASRVENLVDFVQRGNDNRKRTGEGFTFLNIPRSYYGTLAVKQLTDANVGGGGLSLSCAHAVMDASEQCRIMSPDGAVDLEMTRQDVDDLLRSVLQNAELDEYVSHEAAVLDVILHSRYINLYKLLRHHLSEESYLGLVRNQILVDVQGDDLLYQIFTANILQRNSGEEAPFLEFIQRVCSECKDENGCPVPVKPGCGGFGIRNFLTLFLSIEVSKAMMDVAEARANGDTDKCAYAQAMVDCFTDQLNESNPILTDISDSMTEEGQCRDRMERCETEEEAQKWREKMEAVALKKEAGNARLMECSSKYKDIMKALREGHEQ